MRELALGLVLQVKPLLSANQLALEQKVLEPVKALGYRTRGVVSDNELALRLAVAQVWPTAAHQTCQLHCLQDAATCMNDAMTAKYTFTGKVAAVLICYGREKFAFATTRLPQVNQAGVSTSTVNHAFVNTY